MNECPTCGRPYGKRRRCYFCNPGFPKLHTWAKPKTGTDRPCDFCGKAVWTKPSRAARSKAVFCDRRCKGAAISALYQRTWRDRFWAKVQDGPGCWEWQGRRYVVSPKRFDYGIASIHGKHAPAHRVSWELHYGPIPDGLWVLHKCDNPPCVRPDHLWLGSPAENTRDAIAKGRFRPVTKST